MRKEAALGRPREIEDQEILRVARKTFIERGGAISVAEIARELGVSHTTIFNRFGTKEALLVAALSPDAHAPVLDALIAGPDDRPLKDQLIEHAIVMSQFVADMQQGVAVLQGCGIDVASPCAGDTDVSGPVQTYRELTGWLRRAQAQDRLGACDVDALATTLLGVMHTSSARICAAPERLVSNEVFITEFVELLWTGVRGSRP